MRSDAVNTVWWGGPGAGKGTQGRIDSQATGRPLMTASELLKRVVQSGSELGREIAAIMARGDLMPDEPINKMVTEEISCPQFDCGVNFDGYPRSKGQAVYINQLLHSWGVRPLTVIYLEVDEKALIYRMKYRVVCGTCNRSYHLLDDPPPVPGACNCGGVLEQRPDDANPETVANRLAKFNQNVKPLKDYFESTKQLVVIECGNLTKEQVTAKIRAALAARR